MPLANFQPERVLQQWLQTLYETEYAPLKFRQFIPISHEVSAGAESFIVYQRDKVGQAGMIKRGRRGEFPPVSATVSKLARPVIEFGDMFEYSIQEVANAGMPGAFALDRTLRDDAYWFTEKKLDDVAALGVTEVGWTGLVNDANVPVVAGLTGTWSTATADQIIADVTALYNAIYANTLENHRGKLLLVPSLQWGYLLKPRSTNSDTTVLQFLQQNFQGLMVDTWDKLDGAGAGAVDRMVMLDPDRRVLEYYIAQEFMTTDPQLYAKVYEVYGSVRTAGLQVRYPKALAYGDGI